MLNRNDAYTGTLQGKRCDPRLLVARWRALEQVRLGCAALFRGLQRELSAGEEGVCYVLPAAHQSIADQPGRWSWCGHAGVDLGTDIDDLVFACSQELANPSMWAPRLAPAWGTPVVAAGDSEQTTADQYRYVRHRGLLVGVNGWNHYTITGQWCQAQVRRNAS